MAAMVYNEWYGEVTVALNRALKKFNVSPHDYRELEDEFGEGSYDAILAAVKERSKGEPDGSWKGVYRARCCW